MSYEISPIMIGDKTIEQACRDAEGAHMRSILLQHTIMMIACMAPMLVGIAFFAYTVIHG